MRKQLAREIAQGCLSGQFPTENARYAWEMRLTWAREDLATVCCALLSARGGIEWRMEAATTLAECGLRTIAERSQR